MLVKTKIQNKDNKNRRSIRLPHYDYSHPGYCFVTVCVNNRESLLGKIEDGRSRSRRGTACCAPSQYGQIVYNEWINTGKLRNNVELDEFIVMPNHFHGIVIINESGTARRAPTGFGKPVARSLSAIMRSFKSAVTKRINESRKMPGAQFWQRNYYEHVIRDDNDLINIREYIVNNPARWQEDEYYIAPSRSHYIANIVGVV
ncbi:MAG: transposase [Candidatus Omnitrophota bacterium]